MSSSTRRTRCQIGVFCLKLEGEKLKTGHLTIHLRGCLKVLTREQVEKQRVRSVTLLIRRLLKVLVGVSCTPQYAGREVDQASLAIVDSNNDRSYYSYSHHATSSATLMSSGPHLSSS